MYTAKTVSFPATRIHPASFNAIVCNKRDNAVWVEYGFSSKEEAQKAAEAQLPVIIQEAQERDERNRAYHESRRIQAQAFLERQSPEWHTYKAEVDQFKISMEHCDCSKTYRQEQKQYHQMLKKLKELEQ